jgi:hypothetical protein
MQPEAFLELAARDPQAAADHLDRAAAQLKDVARELRTPKAAGQFTVGVTDRVRVAVLDHSGQLKQCVDTKEPR